MRLPSKKTLRPLLCAGLKSGLTAAQAGKQARALMRARDMEGLSALYEMHGVETIKPSGWDWGQSLVPGVFEYLNAGDTYALTVVRHFAPRPRYEVTTLGDVVERMERRGVRYE